MDNKLIVAHRGASKLARENTLEAFQKAVDVGADMAELDVRRTRDGQLVVHHNEILGWRLIRFCSYQTINGIAKRRGYEISTLEEVLRQNAGKIKFDIELKEKGYEGEVVRLALKYMQPKDFVVTSFRAPLIISIKKNFPEVSAGLLLEPFASTVYHAVYFADSSYLADSLTRRRQAVEVSDFLVFYKLLYILGVAGRAKYSKKRFFIYTVDKEKQIASYWRDPRLMGIITNTPDRARRAIA